MNTKKIEKPDKRLYLTLREAVNGDTFINQYCNPENVYVKTSDESMANNVFSLSEFCYVSMNLDDQVTLVHVNPITWWEK